VAYTGALLKSVQAEESGYIPRAKIAAHASGFSGPEPMNAEKEDDGARLVFLANCISGRNSNASAAMA
jgi:hypothetical protein